MIYQNFFVNLQSGIYLNSSLMSKIRKFLCVISLIVCALSAFVWVFLWDVVSKDVAVWTFFIMIGAVVVFSITFNVVKAEEDRRHREREQSSPTARTKTVQQTHH